MANFCLTKQFTDKFLKGLKSGEINPEAMAKMTSDERRSYLNSFVGEDNAKQVNALFESKMLLKNQKEGYITWAKKVGGISPQAKKDLISRIAKLDRVLNPEEEKQFLKDLAETKLGVGVSEEEAKQIHDLSQKVSDAKTSQKKDLTFETEAQRLAYGRAQVNLYNYVNDLHIKAKNAFSLNPLKVADKIAANSKAIKASLDDSAIFRQGWKTLWTHPGTWAKNAVKSLGDIVRTFGGKPVMDELNADIISRPTYDMMKRAKLAVGTVEEAFPTSLPEKVPLLGRVYKASENAYTAFVHKTRADVFDKYIQIAQKRGVDLNDNELKAIGSMVNSLTGRANLPGDLERAANVFNNIFFSPRYFFSEVDTLGHVLTGAGGSNFVRKQAAINLVKVISGTAAVLAVANAIKPGSVEWDPRSSDFGKIKVGNTRFDVSGGLGSLVTLASRLITQSTKSSTTGTVTPLNTGQFGATTTKDIVYNYFENKLSPAASIIKELLEGKDFAGNKPTVGGELKNLFEPLLASNMEELLKDPNSANTLVAMLADGLGIATNTYSITPKDWSQEPTVQQQAFLDRVGDDKFKEANDKFNAAYKLWFDTVSTTEAYKNLSSDGKSTLLSNAKDSLQEKIFKQYRFVYKKQKETIEKKQELRKIKSLTP